LRQIFYILTDDKIGSGPRPAPHSLHLPGQSDKTSDKQSEGSGNLVGAEATSGSSGQGGTGGAESTASDATVHDHDYDMDTSSSQSVKRKNTNPSSGRSQKR